MSRTYKLPPALLKNLPKYQQICMAYHIVLAVGYTLEKSRGHLPHSDDIHNKLLDHFNYYVTNNRRMSRQKLLSALCDFKDIAPARAAYSSDAIVAISQAGNALLWLENPWSSLRAAHDWLEISLYNPYLRRSWKTKQRKHLFYAYHDIVQQDIAVPTNPTLVRICKAIYTEKNFSLVGHLADALEDVKADQQVIDHLRGQKTHYYGCWVMTKILHPKLPK